MTYREARMQAAKQLAAAGVENEAAESWFLCRQSLHPQSWFADQIDHRIVTASRYTQQLIGHTSITGTSARRSTRRNTWESTRINRNRMMR